ncbi:MAG TPA: cytidylate kinase-like family protein [Pyrinomonadaceae bacterium]|nr:cytidylate kinase-like family protein [Pyrinomonadaceae bacterium]
MESRTTVTIARRMGSGGAYVGRVIAERLNLRYVDREVLQLAAERLGVEASALEPNRERVAGFWERFFGSLSFGPPEGTYAPPPVQAYSDKALFECQSGVLRELAAHNDCVIVGYGAAYVLPRHARMVNIFFHAPVSFRVRRVAEIYKADEARARQMVEESDRVRARYFREMTGRDWACADNYHLCVDTSMSPLPELAERLVRFVERRLGSARED